MIDSALKSCLGKILSGYTVIAAYLFGSVASGRTTPLSDVDIALLVDEAQFQKSERLKFELIVEEQIAQHCGIGRCDVRVINDAPVIIRGEVITNGILLFCMDEDARVEFETRTLAEYFDFIPLVEAVSKAYLEQIRERGFNGQHS